MIFRGKLVLEDLILNLSPLEIAEKLDTLGSDDLMSLAAIIDPKQANVEEFNEADLQGMMGMSVADLEAESNSEKKIKASLIAGFQSGLACTATCRTGTNLSL